MGLLQGPSSCLHRTEWGIMGQEVPGPGCAHFTVTCPTSKEVRGLKVCGDAPTWLGLLQSAVIYLLLRFREFRTENPGKGTEAESESRGREGGSLVPLVSAACRMRTEEGTVGMKPGRAVPRRWRTKSVG